MLYVRHVRRPFGSWQKSAISVDDVSVRNFVSGNPPVVYVERRGSMMSIHEEEFCALVSTLRDVIKVAYYVRAVLLQADAHFLRCIICRYT